mmetsp:Transcript_46014/g.77363  ORF Transcript_46014/g.77363 Transcript_46014/m.77363 type:complete len:204 (+) Transcript_46014:703-1314(+)
MELQMQPPTNPDLCLQQMSSQPAAVGGQSRSAGSVRMPHLQLIARSLYLPAVREHDHEHSPQGESPKRAQDEGSCARPAADRLGLLGLGLGLGLDDGLGGVFALDGAAVATGGARPLHRLVLGGDPGVVARPLAGVAPAALPFAVIIPLCAAVAGLVGPGEACADAAFGLEDIDLVLLLPPLTVVVRTRVPALILHVQLITGQ